MLRCVVVSVSREVPWMVDEIGMITKIGARHIHRAILPEIIPYAHRDGNEGGFNPAAAG
jgi:hypothetical protein